MGKAKNKARLYFALYSSGPSGTQLDRVGLVLLPKEPKENAQLALRFALARHPVLRYLEVASTRDYVRPDDIILMILLGKLETEQDEDWLLEQLRHVPPDIDDDNTAWTLRAITLLTENGVVAGPRSAEHLYKISRQSAEEMLSRPFEDRQRNPVPMYEPQNGFSIRSEVGVYPAKVD